VPEFVWQDDRCDHQPQPARPCHRYLRSPALGPARTKHLGEQARTGNASRSLAGAGRTLATRRCANGECDAETQWREASPRRPSVCHNQGACGDAGHCRCENPGTTDGTQEQSGTRGAPNGRSAGGSRSVREPPSGRTSTGCDGGSSAVSIDGTIGGGPSPDITFHRCGWSNINLNDC
jgi:hypothetical protein